MAAPASPEQAIPEQIDPGQVGPGAADARPAAGDAAGQVAGDHTAFYIRVMHDFVALGSELAQRTVRQSAPPDDADGMDRPRGRVADPSVAFERIGRTVRRSIMLADALAKAAKAPAQSRAQVPSPGAGADPQQRIAARKRIIREVEDVIQRDTDDDEEAETLEAELLDRLDAPEFEDEIDHRPIAEIVTEICRDLGLSAAPGTHPWKRRTPEDVAALCALAAQPYRTPADAAGPCAPRAARLRPSPARPGAAGGRSASSRPAPQDFAGHDPGCHDPGCHDPGCHDPGWHDPGWHGPGSDDPGSDDPGSDDPGSDDPGWDEPGRDDPGGHGPGGVEPGAGEPARSKPGEDEPARSEPAGCAGGGRLPPTQPAGHPGPGHPGPGHTGPGHPGPGHTGPGHTGPGPGAPIAHPIPPPRPARHAATLLHGPPWSLGR